MLSSVVLAAGTFLFFSVVSRAMKVLLFYVCIPGSWLQQLAPDTVIDDLVQDSESCDEDDNEGKTENPP